MVYETPWLPRNIRLSQDRIAQMVYVYDVLKCAVNASRIAARPFTLVRQVTPLAARRYDIMLTSTVMAFERMPFTRFSLPVQPWGSILLVRAPTTVKEPSASARLFTWATPFTGEAWVALVGASCFVGMTMTLCVCAPAAFSIVVPLAALGGATKALLRRALPPFGRISSP